MKISDSLLIGALAVLAMVGCAKSSSDRSGSSPNDNGKGTGVDQKTVAVDLSGKSVEDVLKIKYDKVELKCALWTQQTHELDLSRTPTDSASVDLKANPTVPGNLTLKGQIQNHQIEIDMTVSPVEIYAALHHTDTRGNVYIAKNTPHVKIDYTVKQETIFGPGQYSTGDRRGTTEVNEKIIDVTLNESEAIQPKSKNGVTVDRGAFRDYVQCGIDTEIKPEYQDQFKSNPQE